MNYLLYLYKILSRFCIEYVVKCICQNENYVPVKVTVIWLLELTSDRCAGLTT